MIVSKSTSIAAKTVAVMVRSPEGSRFFAAPVVIPLRETSPVRLEEQPTEDVPGGEEQQYHQGHDQGDRDDHRRHAWAVVAHSRETLSGAVERLRSASR